jgi:hypothetical protein
MYWRKIILFTFAVLLPAVIVGISNLTVFPDSSLAATLMLLVTVGIAGVFTYFSGDATAKVRRYCILADVAICAILCVNLGGHWILAREVSAARQGVEERHAEEDRELQREKAKTELEIARKQAEAELAKQNAVLQNAERRRLAQLPPSERRSTLSAPKAEPTKAPTIQPMALVSGSTAAVSVPIVTSAPRLTPEQVRQSWWWFLTALAIAECAASVLAGAILAGVWEWDRDHDGIPDHLQKPTGVGTPREIVAGK